MIDPEVIFDVQLAPVTDFDPASKVWMYASSRLLNEEELNYIQEETDIFVRQWTAHNHALKAEALILERKFLCLIVDETQAMASGCSIDKSVAFMRQLGQKFDIDWFDRLTFVYKDDNGHVQNIHKDELTKALEVGIINHRTVFFNTLVKNKMELMTQWQLPLENSWHRRFM